MVGPVIGPIPEIRTNNKDGPGSYRNDRLLWRQKRPFNLTLAYRLIRCHTDSAVGIGLDAERDSFGENANASSIASPWQRVQANLFTQGYLQTQLDQARNSARDRFSSKLGAEAGWMLNLVQRKQAMEMMSNRLLRLAVFAGNLRKLNFKTAMDVLGWKLTSTRRLDEKSRLLRYQRHGTEERRTAVVDTRRTAKGFANNFLELHFGWEPVVNDIQETIDFLDSPIPFGRIEGRGKKIPVDELYYSPGYNSYRRMTLRGYVQARCGADVVVTNANLYAAARMGLSNPLTTALDAVPWSFVVGWFVNIFEYLKQFDEFNGIQFIEPWTTWHARLQSEDIFYMKDNWGREAGWSIKMSGVFAERELGIPSVVLGLRPAWRLSPTRALTAISLLLQKLKV